ncbi:Phosphonopyruvate decarboxylase [Frankia canadensis]|uniref:Phosphonopyruvate decarboxylase n=2 Tax=Frankia canadensis TaxID=1836972 RepID=A0A2I2L196_9ACTN|nr:phosphonopyruvate decarboxylase [Frankia canadensis]SNQ51637.1 Phosphonopyruvate decarboxylase [Frankia canadensis]SOU58927.1 Phosphonopyruvate decarboxylase [Frankia canadensis]
MDAERFCAVLRTRGFTAATGVPCSYLAGPIEVYSRAGRYVPAANEGAALGIAAGGALAGTRVAVFAQNSGLGNMVNPLASLLMTYDLPVLAFVSLRGWPDPAGDEPQHAVMGGATAGLLDALGAAWWLLRRGADGLDTILDETEHELARGRPAFVLVEKGAVGSALPIAPVPVPVPAPAPAPAGEASRAPSRLEVLRALLPELRGLPVVATTGYTSRELFALGDAANHFYMQGSMGHAAAVALGLAWTAPAGRPVVVLDGDGAALMHLGTMSTIGATAPPNLVHVVFDNGTYASTGAQATTSPTTDLAAVALACGYRAVRGCARPEDAHSELRGMLARPGPHLLVVRVAATDGGTAPPRATSAVSAPDLHRRFHAWLAETSATPVAP